MKTILKISAILFLIIAALVVIWHLRANSGSLGDRLESALQAQAADPKKGANPNPVPAPVERPSPKTRVDAAAAQARVTVLEYTDLGSYQDVKLQWKSDSVGPGGDFLDSLVNAGCLRDFKETAKLVSYKDGQGRTVYTASYRLQIY